VFKPILVSCSVLVLTLSVLTAPISANAQDSKDLKINQKSQKDTSKILDNLKQKDPQKLESQKLERNRNDQNELNSDQKDLKVKFDLKNKKVKLSSTDKGETSINIPNKNELDSVDIVDNKVVYSGKNSKIDVVVESIDGGVRQVINIKDSSAPDFYDFPVEIGRGEKLEITENAGAVVKNAKGETKIAIAKPWAKDNNGKDLKTWYTVEKGNILRQNINLKDAVFPVAADPTWCGDQISTTSWVRNPQGWTLRVIPTYCGRFLGTDYSDAWNQVLFKTSSYAYQGYNLYYVWNKQYGTSQYWSMRDQFTCHYANPVAIIVKSEWNLDLWRPNVGLNAMYRAGCNP
jgi:hypothetical protein